MILGVFLSWFSRLFRKQSVKNFTQKIGRTIGAVLTRLLGSSSQFNGNPLQKAFPYLLITTPKPLNNTEKFKKKALIPNPHKLRGVLNPNYQNADTTVYSDVLGRSDTITISIEKGNIYLEGAAQKNGIWRKRWLVLPEALNNKTTRLKHRDTFFIGSPYSRRAVKIELRDPPLPILQPFFWIWEVPIRRVVLPLLGVLTITALALLAMYWAVIPGEILPNASLPTVVYARDRQTHLQRFKEAQPFIGKVSKEQPFCESYQKEIDQLLGFPSVVSKSVIASEDKRFCSHIGVDFLGMGRALLKFGSQGASTITQQVAKTIFPDFVGLEPPLKKDENLLDKLIKWRDLLSRKAREMAVAIKMERFHSKDEILLTYINKVFLGRNNRGFVEAARDYFKDVKSEQDISLDQAATLVAMIPAPNYFDPCENRSRFGALNKYRDDLINDMQKQKLVNSEQAERGKTFVQNLFDLDKCELRTETSYLPRIYDSEIYNELSRLSRSTVEEDGLIVETTLDSQKQKKAKDSLGKTIAELKSSQKGVSQGAMVSINASTGEILALVSAIEPQEYCRKEINPKTKEEEEIFCDYAAVEELKPGSTYKVFGYAANLKNNPENLQKQYDCKQLKEFDFKTVKDLDCQPESKKMDMQTAMAVSSNLVAIKVADEAGLDKVIDLVKQLGVSSLNRQINDRNFPYKPKLRLILGESGTKLLELTSAYGVLANKGLYNEPHVISSIYKITDGCDFKSGDYVNNSRCSKRYAANSDLQKGLEPVYKPRQVLDALVADKVTQLMRGVVNREDGTAFGAVTIRNAVGKTGTSECYDDLWFIGYVPNDPNHLVTGVWLGNPDHKRNVNLTKDGSCVKPILARSSDAARVWNEYMKSLEYLE